MGELQQKLLQLDARLKLQQKQQKLEPLAERIAALEQRLVGAIQIQSLAMRNVLGMPGSAPPGMGLPPGFPPGMHPAMASAAAAAAVAGMVPGKVPKAGGVKAKAKNGGADPRADLD